jgi:hypothetical protein
MNFQYVNPADLHSVWDFVDDGLEIVRQRTRESWIPEDVYYAIKAGLAQLFMIPDGFVVLQNNRDQWTNEPILHIWITYHSKTDDMADDFHSNLRKIADNVGAKSITFSSPRRWERRSGAKVKTVVYELEN